MPLPLMDVVTELFLKDLFELPHTNTIIDSGVKTIVIMIPSGALLPTHPHSSDNLIRPTHSRYLRSKLTSDSHNRPPYCCQLYSNNSTNPIPKSARRSPHVPLFSIQPNQPAKPTGQSSKLYRFTPHKQCLHVTPKNWTSRITDVLLQGSWPLVTSRPHSTTTGSV